MSCVFKTARTCNGQVVKGHDPHNEGKDEEHKLSVIVDPDTVPHPWTVTKGMRLAHRRPVSPLMVSLIVASDASIANPAMFGS